MDTSDVIMKRQSVRTRFKNVDMDFVFSWVLGVGEIIGMAHGEIFATAATIKDGDPVSSRAGFHRQADFLSTRAQEFARADNEIAAGQSAFGSAFARRAAPRSSIRTPRTTNGGPW